MIEQINSAAEIWSSWMWPMFVQVSVLVILIGGVDLLIRKRAWPQVRYALWSLVLVKLLCPPTFALPTSLVSQLRPLAEQLYKRKATINELATIPPLHANFRASELWTVAWIEPDLALDDVTDSTAAADAIEPTRSQKPSWQAYAMAGWILGVLTLGLWLIVRFRQLRRTYCGRAKKPSPPPWLERLLARTAERLNLERLPEVVLSKGGACPAVFGVFRPVLLLPAQNVGRLSPKETEHILLHELAHLKRGDLKVHALSMLIQVVYWFNPLLWPVRRHLQHLRELCCDATVAGILREQTPEYRGTILETTRWLLTRPRISGLGLVGLAENPCRLAARLRWLEKETWKHRGLRIATVLAVVALMCVCVLPMAKARQVAPDESPQSSDLGAEAEPEFLEVADATKDDSEPAIMPSGSAEVLPKAQILFDCKFYEVPADVGIVEANQQVKGQKNPFVVLEGSEHADRLQALSQRHPDVRLLVARQVLAKNGEEAFARMTGGAASGVEFKVIGRAKYGGQVISMTLDLEHKGRMSIRGHLATRNDEPLVFGWRMDNDTEEILVITPHLLTAEDPAVVQSMSGPRDGSTLAQPQQIAVAGKAREVVAVGTGEGESRAAAVSICTSDFDQQAKQLREILAGGISSILTGLRDDKGASVVIVHFKGIEDKPLVFHLAEQNGSWLIDYFYIGSFEIERQETVPSRKKGPRVDSAPVVYPGTTWPRTGGRMDKNPLAVVGKQIRHLRAILEGQHSGLNIVCGAGEAIQVITELARGTGQVAGYLIYHLTRENGKYHIECMEAPDGVGLQPKLRPGAPDVGVAEPVTPPGDILAFDDFNGKLALDWKILNPDPSHYSLVKKPGALTITTQPGSFSWSHQADYKNLFLIDCPEAKGRDLQLTTCVSSFTPEEHWNQAGLIFWKDQDNYIKCTYQTWYGRRVVAVVTETDGTLINAIHQPTDSEFDKIWLRFTKRTNVYEMAISFDGQSFETHGATRWGEGAITKVGLIALNGSHSSAPELDAAFEFFQAKAVPLRSPDAVPLRGTTLPRVRTSSSPPAGTRLGGVGGRPARLRSGQPQVELSRLLSKLCDPKRVPSNLPDGGKGQALQFDGKDDFVTIPSSKSLDIRGSLTVSAWVKHEGDRHGVIVWRGDGAVALDPYALQSTEGRMIFRMDAGNGRKRRQVVSKGPVDDQWHFWAAVCDEGAGKLHLYRDGQLEDTADIDVKFDYDTSKMWNLFGAAVLGRRTSEHFKGSIDEVRVWNIARSADQIKKDMNRSLTGTERGLVGYWKFDEDMDGIIENRTLYLNNGVAGQLPRDVYDNTLV